MAVARPIITTDAPGCRETVVDGENGFLVPVKDPRALAQAMERFILKPEHRLQRAGRAVLEFHSCPDFKGTPAPGGKCKAVCRI